MHRSVNHAISAVIGVAMVVIVAWVAVARVEAIANLEPQAWSIEE